MTYLFRTKVTMKPHNTKKYWIDESIVREIRVTAESLYEAIELYRCTVENNSCVVISRNAIRNKTPMYVDRKDGAAKQVGFVFSGYTDIMDDYGKTTKQGVDVWTEIMQITNPFEDT